ncbi:MAG: TonB-dependent receptor, partial [Muribaculaceae bacterium]|nr:TonB-dependent receptor [Muribaculaceae bacterium]
MKNMRRVFIGIMVSFMGTAFPATSQSEWVTDSIVMLNEVDIVAVKQQSNLVNLPVSSNTISTDAIQLLDISDIKKVSDIAPNFYIPQYGSRITSSIYVRGIGARMDQPSVGLTIDNVPVMNKDAYDLDLPDIAMIEILRGPQSSLFGRNTMAGLVNIRTLSPMKFQGWRINLNGGLPGSFKLSGGWFKKYSSTLALSANIGVFYNSGEYKNNYDGSMTGKERSGSFRTRLEWQPLPNLSLSNVLAISALRQSGYPYESVVSGKIEFNDECFYRRFLLSDGLSLKWVAPHFDMLSVTSLQWIDDNMTLDQDFLPEDYFTLTQKKQEVSLTEDLTFRGKSDGRYRWIAGMFAFYRHLNMQAPVVFKDKGISELIENHRNTGNPYRPIRWERREFSLNSDFTLPSAGIALYHESKYEFNRWHFSAGLRLDFEHISMKYHSFCSTGYNIYDNPSGVLPCNSEEPDRNVKISIDDYGTLSRNYITILPKITALYDLTCEGDDNIYLSVGRGYKAGGFNTQMFSDVLQQRILNYMGMSSAYDVDKIVSYKPEECWSFEMGSHFNVFENRISSELALFYIDIHNQQLTMFPDGTTTGRIMTNAGKTRSFGAELSVTYKATEALDFNIAYGYTNVRFRKFYNGIVDLKGKVLPYAPSNTLWLQALYTLRLESWGNRALIFDLNTKGNGRIYWNEDNTLYQNFFAQLGASVTLKSDKWELQLYGKNLTDTKYYTFYFKSMGNEFVQRGEG